MSKRVLFVGSFLSTTKTGGFGGQMYACNALVNSSLSEEISWTLIDTTAATNIKVSIFRKLFNAFIRLSKFSFYVIFTKHTHYLIFSSNGLSFREKGIMAIMASKFSKGTVVFAPRSGRLKDEIFTDKINFIRKVFKHSDKVVCQGENWKTLFSNEVLQDSTKYVVQKNWIDPENYKAYQNKDNNKVQILFLGWLVKDKGIMDLLHAAENFVTKKIENVQFNIAGKGQDEELFKQEIEKRNLQKMFTFVGWADAKKKQSLFEKSHIFVLPSYFEGMPNALLESMATGLACIASNVGSIPDVLNGTNGMMFDRDNPQQFINQLERLVLDSALQSELGENARKYILEEHSLKSAVTNFKQNILN